MKQGKNSQHQNESHQTQSRSYQNKDSDEESKNDGMEYASTFYSNYLSYKTF